VSRSMHFTDRDGGGICDGAPGVVTGDGGVELHLIVYPCKACGHSGEPLTDDEQTALFAEILSLCTERKLAVNGGMKPFREESDPLGPLGRSEGTGLGEATWQIEAVESALRAGDTQVAQSALRGFMGNFQSFIRAYVALRAEHQDCQTEARP
jgi:hypothetical protein